MSILQVIDFSLNLYDYITTFVMQDPVSSGGISNINFWAYKRIFSETLWYIFIATTLGLTGAIYTLRFFGPRAEEMGYFQCLMDR